MFSWSSILPVTIFVLANTVCVSQSAATGRQRLMNIQNEGPAAVPPQSQSGEDTDLPLQPEFPSSAEAVVPEWINSHPDKGVDEFLDSMTLSPGGTTRYRYDDDSGIESGMARGRERPQPLVYLSRLLQLPEIDTQLNSHGGTPPGRHFRYRVNGMGGLKPLDKLRPLPVISNAPQSFREQVPALWPAKSNYQLPSDDFIRVNVFDKRSPRCIAKCMQQGMVHPLQCHSLC